MLLNYLIPYMLFHNLLYLLVYNNMFALLLILYYLLVYMFYLLMGLLFLHFLHMDHFLRLYLVELLWLHLLVLHLLLLLFVHHIVVDNDYSYLYMSLFLYILLHQKIHFFLLFRFKCFSISNKFIFLAFTFNVLLLYNSSHILFIIYGPL